MGIVRRAQGARRKAMSVRIVDDEQRSDRPQDPCALRVAAAGGRLLRCGGSTMCADIACASAPSSRPPGARNAAICTFTTDCQDSRRALTEISALKSLETGQPVSAALTA